MKSRWDDLALLLAVVDAGGFTAAAERLGTSTARLSRAVSRLERQLDTTLVQRTTRRLDVTEEGALFIAQARQALDTLEAAEEALTVRRREPAGRLRVDAATPFLLHQIVPHLAAFHAAYPKVRLELTTHETNIDLIEQRTDIAIRIGRLEDSSLHARPLGHSRRRLVASPDYLARHGTPATAEALSAHVLLGFTHLPQLNRWPLRGGCSVTPTLASSSGEALLRMAEAGLGIACLADFLTRDACQAGRLSFVLEDAMLERYEPIQAVYYRNTALEGRIAAFLDFLAGRLTL
ncbi:LysR family transcriptional regulator [Chromohalobacter israelensis]|uniref:LysR family transcriptional regulator n=1 Tax=Chromohalobacter israelensis TaxID=141390 RepID=UPI00265B9A42|nr:LysR family transcriptional regulator [Chromohalobacter salexigens]MDO0946011.1 LysR family transcriptional regulator [Chromohalobacter salexigens]